MTQPDQTSSIFVDAPSAEEVGHIAAISGDLQALGQGYCPWDANEPFDEESMEDLQQLHAWLIQRDEQFEGALVRVALYIAAELSDPREGVRQLLKNDEDTEEIHMITTAGSYASDDLRPLDMHDDQDTTFQFIETIKGN